MAIKEMQLQTIIALDDGRIVEAWNQALKRVVSDCHDRPGCKDSRKITLQLDIEPLVSEDGDLDTVRGQFQIKDSLPVRKTKKYDFEPRRNGSLAFNDLSDDNVHQRTIDEVTND